MLPTCRLGQPPYPHVADPTFNGAIPRGAEPAVQADDHRSVSVGPLHGSGGACQWPRVAVMGRPRMGAAWFDIAISPDTPRGCRAWRCRGLGLGSRDAPSEGLLWVGNGWSRQAAWHSKAHGVTEGRQAAECGRVGSVHCLCSLSRCGALAGLTWASWCGDAPIPDTSLSLCGGLAAGRDSAWEDCRQFGGAFKEANRAQFQAGWLGYGLEFLQQVRRQGCVAHVAARVAAG